MIAAIIATTAVLIILFLPIRAAASVFIDLNRPQMAYRTYLYNLIPIISGAIFVDGGSLVIVGKKAKRVELSSLTAKPSSGSSVLKAIKIRKFQIDLQLSVLGEGSMQKAQILSALSPLVTAVAADRLGSAGSINTTYTLHDEKLFLDLVAATSIFALLIALLKKNNKRR